LTEESVNVELSGLLNPDFTNGFSNVPPSGSLISQGVETVALRPMVASQLNASPGLLVVYVDPSSVAFESGLRPADVIESIDGKPVPVGANNFFPGSVPGAKSSFEIVRKKQKVVIKVRAPQKND
jgi:Trypsin-like serine proteases, typically periplasmic, contain C-terminal PDZ domain